MRKAQLPPSLLPEVSRPKKTGALGVIDEDFVDNAMDEAPANARIDILVELLSRYGEPIE